MQHGAGEPCQSIGEPLPDGTGIDIFHTAGIHNYVDTLPLKKRSLGSIQTPVTSPSIQTWPYVTDHAPTHLEEFGHLGHVAGTSTFPGIRHILTNLQCTQQRRGLRTGGAEDNNPQAQQATGPGCLPKNWCRIFPSSG